VSMAGVNYVDPDLVSVPATLSNHLICSGSRFFSLARITKHLKTLGRT
jgi:hypothetical protein